MSAVDVIREAMLEAFQYSVKGADPEDVLNAIETARYAVVELPEFDSLEHFEIRNGVVREYDPNGFGSYRVFTLAEIPSLAAALLADVLLELANV